MRRYVVLHKPQGATPLEVATAWKTKENLPVDTPISYAGRLDPMAHGKLLLLIGDECKRQSKYTALDKEYVIQVLLDVGTDTGDVLGIPTLKTQSPPFSTAQIRTALSKERGTHTVPYPVFSSKTVKGKPLFMYALENKLDDIAVPTHEETFYKIDLIDTRSISNEELDTLVTQSLSRAPTSDEPSKALGADFRIGTIRPAWENLLQTKRSYQVLTLRVTCGSGAYMRTLANRIAKNLGTTGCALSIERTIIGRYFPALGIWLKRFR